MKLMVTVNLKKLVKEYNGYSVIFKEEPITISTLYDLLEQTLGNALNATCKTSHVILTVDEAERFAAMFIEDGWKELAFDTASSISFFH